MTRLSQIRALTGQPFDIQVGKHIHIHKHIHAQILILYLQNLPLSVCLQFSQLFFFNRLSQNTFCQRMLMSKASSHKRITKKYVDGSSHLSQCTFHLKSCFSNISLLCRSLPLSSCVPPASLLGLSLPCSWSFVEKCPTSFHPSNMQNKLTVPISIAKFACFHLQF